MNGTGVPMVTPFDDDGDVDADALASVTGFLEDGGVDFLVPCGSTSEAPMMSVDERARVVETVADATALPVMAGTGHPSLETTLEQTRRAAAAGADAALVVTPFYYGHDDDVMARYYRAVADAASIPVYCYSVPVYTGVTLDPGTVADVATHPNVAGIKDSSGDVGAAQRMAHDTAAADFSVLVGAGGVYAPALDVGADGGILALANVVPDRAAEIHRRHREGDAEGARELTADLQALNRTITARYGVPGVKAALEHRGVDAGRPRQPFTPLSEGARETVEELVDAALAD